MNCTISCFNLIGIFDGLQCKSIYIDGVDGVAQCRDSRRFLHSRTKNIGLGDTNKRRKKLDEVIKIWVGRCEN